jgi:WhiB family redox-sensing transcriptional regulator
MIPDLPIDYVPIPTRRARCADGHGTLSHLFFSSDDVDVARAKAICRRCTMAKDCLQGALERQEAYGVWGGTLLINGTPVALPTRRGRPPTGPRVEFLHDEVPIPDHLVA